MTDRRGDGLCSSGCGSDGCDGIVWGSITCGSISCGSIDFLWRQRCAVVVLAEAKAAGTGKGWHSALLSPLNIPDNFFRKIILFHIFAGKGIWTVTWQISRWTDKLFSGNIIINASKPGSKTGSSKTFMIHRFTASFLCYNFSKTSW